MSWSRYYLAYLSGRLVSSIELKGISSRKSLLALKEIMCIKHPRLNYTSNRALVHHKSVLNVLNMRMFAYIYKQLILHRSMNNKLYNGPIKDAVFITVQRCKTIMSAGVLSLKFAKLKSTNNVVLLIQQSHMLNML